MLDERKAAILQALVEEYIESGEPVSSRAILDRSGLTCSSATIRNEMVVLEQGGYITKPHTSAGRIPTDAGYRTYVQHLGPRATSPLPRRKVDEFFASMHLELNRMLEKTSELLSEITEYPSVVVGPKVAGRTIRDIHLVPIQGGNLLLIIVTQGGRVSQAVIPLGDEPSARDVDAAESLLSDVLDGAAMDPGELTVTDELRAQVGQEARAVVDRVIDAMRRLADGGRDVFVGGTSRMAGLWEDLAKLHRVLGIVERKTMVAQMLAETPDGTTVRIGAELPAGEDDLAVVSARYEAAGAKGSVGVFGPMRMDYGRAIRAVEEVSDALGDSLGS